MKTMKRFYLLPLALLAAACSSAPTIDDLKEVINFHGTDYDKYTVNVYKSE